MTVVKARVRAVGFRGGVEGVVLVNTGASLTLLDMEVAKAIRVKSVGRRVRAVVTDGHELGTELAVLEELVVEGEELPYAYTAVVEFPNGLRGRLRELGLAYWCILGLTTLELLQLVPDTTTGRLRKTAAILI